MGCHKNNACTATRTGSRHDALVETTNCFFLFIYLLICYGKIEKYWYSVTSKEEMYKFSYMYNQLE